MADGDGSSRNFRSTYYEKLGFNGNEEKNVLDSLIASSLNLDPEELSEFCSALESDKRCLETWKALLGFGCSRNNPFDEFANVRRVRAEHFQLLKHHLMVLMRLNIVKNNRLKLCSELLSSSKLSQKPGEQSKNGANDLPVQDNGDSTQVTIETNDYINSNENDELESDTQKIPDGKKCIKYAPVENAVDEQRNLDTTADELLKEMETNPGKLIALMYLLEIGQLESLLTSAQLDLAYFRKLSAVAKFFVNVSRDLQEAFFLFRNFTKKAEEDETLKKAKSDSGIEA